MNLAAIQEELQKQKLDGWLFFDHHRRDPLAYRVLRFTPGSMVSRRWYYFIPAQGDARKLEHKIESHTLDELPGTKSLYAEWGEMVDRLRDLTTNPTVRSNMDAVSKTYQTNGAATTAQLIANLVRQGA